MTPANVFERISAILQRADIPYMLVGSFASSHYGAMRSTYDIDFVIAATLEQLRTLIRLLPQEEYYRDLESAIEAHNHQSMFNIIDMATGLKIDFIMSKPTAFGREQFRRRTKAEVEGTAVFVATPEDVILSKLQWAQMGQSLRQLEDIAGILKFRRDSLDHSYLQKWIAELGLTAEWKKARQQAGFE